MVAVVDDGDGEPDDDDDRNDEHCQRRATEFAPLSRQKWMVEGVEWTLAAVARGERGPSARVIHQTDTVMTAVAFVDVVVVEVVGESVVTAV